MKHFSQKLVAITLIVIALTGCKKDDPSIEVSNIVLDKEQIALGEGGTEQLTATVLPEEATDKTVTWTSSDETIATVDDKGEVTAVKTGTASITVTTKDGGKTATCEVTVVVPSMTFTTTKAVGEKIWLQINAEAADQAGVWIDLNNNGKKDDGEAVTTFDDKKRVEYILDAQTVTLYGKVIFLNCFSNQLTLLDISKNTQLTVLNCNFNDLEVLDVSQNTQLNELSCNNNKLTQLDVSNNTQLTVLNCMVNQLKALDLSNNKVLTKLYCDANQLKALNVTQNAQLIHLSCTENQLTQLDISNNTALEVLSCDSNQLTQLDISKNKRLKMLWCYNNPKLTRLNVANGNNSNFKSPYRGDEPAFDATNCPKLTCIKVDNGFDPAGQTGTGKKWKKDDTASWHNDGTDCP